MHHAKPAAFDISPVLHHIPPPSRLSRPGITTVGEFHYFHHGIDYETEPSARYKYDTLVLEAAQEVQIWTSLYK
jgi:hypothetical protein